MKKFFKILKWVAVSLVAVIVLPLTAVFVARAVNAARNSIKTPNGIQESTMVNIGGIQQYIQIRGQDAGNPVILFLHGGPGSATGFLSNYYQIGLEERYTFVQWDQRGCGRTYFANPNMDVDTELSVGILLNDIDELTDYLTRRFNQEKIIVMGHSWGTVLGSQYVMKHPEKVAMYIGVGQVVNLYKGDILAAETAKQIAADEGRAEDVKKLEMCMEEYSEAWQSGTLDVNILMSDMRPLASKYLPRGGETSFLRLMWLGITSPDMSWNDLRWYLTESNYDIFMKTQRPLHKSLIDFDVYNLGAEYQIPVYFISGENDWVCPVTLIEEYCEKVSAPAKETILIPAAGHNSPFLDNKEAFQVAMEHCLSGD